MKTSYLDLDGHWGIVCVYDYNVEEEYDELAAVMKSFNVPLRQIRRSLEILSAPNTGMTVTFPEIRMTLVMISSATSKDQLFSTISHEMYHATCGIIRYYDREMCSEDAAYTMGELMRQVITEVMNSDR